MTNEKRKMNFSEKATVLLTAIGASIAFLVLILGDNVIRLAYKPDILLSDGSLALAKVSSFKEHVRIFDFYNQGSAASLNIKLVARFSSADLKFSVESDEEYKEIPLKPGLIEVSLERFSPRSHVRIFIMSKDSNQLLETYYIDDKGKTIIDPNRRTENSEYWLKVAAVVMFVTMIFWLIVVFIRGWESRLSADWRLMASDLSDKIEQLKSDVGEIADSAESQRASPPTPPYTGQQNSGASSRIHDLLGPQPPRS